MLLQASSCKLAASELDGTPSPHGVLFGCGRVVTILDDLIRFGHSIARARNYLDPGPQPQMQDNWNPYDQGIVTSPAIPGEMHRRGRTRLKLLCNGMQGLARCLM